MDYNLFPVFVEIMRHRNISKASRALGMTQPAASNALARLRHQFGDPLFIRASHGVVPTQLATKIAPDIELHVEQLKLLTHTQTQKSVDLSQITRRFKIISHDMEETLILPAVVKRLSKEAPNIQLEIRPYNHLTLKEELSTNQADIVLAYLRDIHKNLVSHTLLYQDFVCVCRLDHPTINARLSLKRFIAESHMIVSPDKGDLRGLVDDELKKLNLSRKVVLSAPHFLSSCQIVSESDYILTLPRNVATQALKNFPLKMFELPLEMNGFSTSIHWHRRLDNDPEHKAFRALILEVVELLK